MANGPNIGFGKQDEIEKVRSQSEEKFGITARFDGSNMTKPDEIEKMIPGAEKAFGSVDIIASNGGITEEEVVRDVLLGARPAPPYIRNCYSRLTMPKC
jgi:NAD(P)-dependent dehydrogenase (short-subunit alcohol dehydrogenase family)